MNTPIIIYGAGGFAREVLQLILDANKVLSTWDPIGFLVDSDITAPSSIHGLPVIRGSEWLKAHPETQIVIAVGSSIGRRKIASKLSREYTNKFATLVHPQALVGLGVEIGLGTIICAGAIVTTDINIGNHVLINIGSTVGHDAMLNNFVTLNPGVHISGNVVVDEGTEIGTGSVLLPQVKVGAWSIVGAGSVVINSLSADVTAVGSPSRIIKTRLPNWHEEGIKK